MKIIEQIEIKSFRSFGNRVKEKTLISKIKDLNIFSGANDSGKSNILRALNLFFNKKTNLDDFLDFKNDFFKRENSDKKDIKEEMITIKIVFLNKNNKDKNLKNDYVRLPEKFWVSRKWKKTSEYSNYNQVSGIETEFKKEKEKRWKDIVLKDLEWPKIYETKELVKLKQHAQASLSRQLFLFLESIQYHYIPAIKDKNYFSHLYGELQQTLLKEENSDLNKNKSLFQVSIQESTKILMDEFKKSVNIKSANFLSVFELPDLIELFKTLNVSTGSVNLQYRGDGIQAKLIPEILDFIAQKELKIKPSKIKKGEKPKKYFIWGFEEPENSYEYKNAQLLANKFKNNFTTNAQIFLTTHSFNFLSIEGEKISTYRVWKDEKIESSRISKIIKETNGQFKFEGKEFYNNYDRLNEELGVFQLNQDLEKLYIKMEEKKKEFQEKINKIEKPIIYTEGNNTDYIKKAKEIFDSNLDIEIESLGGKDDIKKIFQRFSDANFSRYKIFFIFDCDANKEFNICENLKTDSLIPYIFKQNTNNNIEELQNGIENLFDEELFNDEEKVFSILETLKDGNIISRKRKLRKPEFCNFVCNENNNDDDFKNFKNLFEEIKKIID